MTPLNLNHSEEVKGLMEDFIARAVELYSGLSDQPVSRPIKSQSLKRLKAQDIPADGRDIKDIYQEMLDDVFSSAILLQHPRSFSCIPSTASLLSWMGDTIGNKETQRYEWLIWRIRSGFPRSPQGIVQGICQILLLRQFAPRKRNLFQG